MTKILVTVVPVVREGADLRGLHGLDLEPVYADVLDKNAVRAALESKPDAVIHLAQPYSLDESDPDAIIRPAVTGTENVFAAMKDAGVKRVVYTGSNAAVGMADDADKPLDETTFRDSSKLPYIEAKIRGERCAMELAKEHGLDSITVLPVAVFGRWDFKTTPTTQSVYEAVNGKGPLPMALSVTDVRDVGAAHLLALENGKPGERYLIGGDVVLPERVADILEELSGYRPSTKWPPYFVLNLAVTVLGWVKKAPISKDALEDVYGKHFAYDSSKAKRDLGYEPRNAKETLTDALRWGALMRAFKPAVNESLSAKLPPEPEWEAAMKTAR
jgi:dihydroflavonol-4-reductase